jgi:hypothetical protein
MFQLLYVTLNNSLRKFRKQLTKKVFGRKVHSLFNVLSLINESMHFPMQVQIAPEPGRGPPGTSEPGDGSQLEQRQQEGARVQHVEEGEEGATPGALATAPAAGVGFLQSRDGQKVITLQSRRR